MEIMDEEKFYAVEAKCGHVGRHHCIVITFPVKAKTGKKAAEIARMIPRVKHNHKDAILSVTRISKEEYLLLLEENHNDEYLHCKNIQQQKENCADLSSRIIFDSYFNEEKRKEDREQRLIYKKKKYLSLLVGERYNQDYFLSC